MHDGQAAPRAIEPRRHNEHWHTGSSHPRLMHVTKMGRVTTLPQPPNGLPFSCRKRATQTVKMRTISGAQRSAGTAGWAGWPPPLACSWHDRTTPARDHASITGAWRNHPPHTITRCTTSARLEPPQARAHARHNGQTAPRTLEPRLHNGQSAPPAIEPRLHDGNLHNGRSHPKPAHVPKKECATTLPQPPNGMPFSCRKRITQTVKNQPILRAKRSAATACSAAAAGRLTREHLH